MVKISKIFWNILAILWIPFECIYIIATIEDGCLVSISKIGDFLSNKVYENNNNT